MVLETLSTYLDHPSIDSGTDRNSEESGVAAGSIVYFR